MDSMRSQTRLTLTLFLSLLPLAGCQSPEDNAAQQGPATVQLANNSKLRISIQDSSAGAPYQAATIRILRVDLHSSSHDRWQMIPIQATSLNLLDLANGASLILAQAKAPAGNYDQIR